jgi:cyclopropane fatty-acyl-phospholipid synthase-like methyltransferase
LEGLGASYLRLLRTFRKKDLVEFCNTHDRLFGDAKRSGEYSKVTEHYYDMMACVIETYYGSSFHFCPPEYPKQSRVEATQGLHYRIARMLAHGAGKNMLDVGCGIGEAIRDIAAYSGGKVTGVTLSQHEVEEGNALIEQIKLMHLCRIVQGDCRDMPFDENTFDSAYAVYALKYFVDLHPVLEETCRVLKPVGLFLVYDIVKTEKYDDTDDRMTDIVGRFEYYCGMPPLHTISETIDVAEETGFACISRMDLSREYPWYYPFVASRLFVWMLNSRLLSAGMWMGERFRVLPRGFKQFSDMFLFGTIRVIVEAGEAGILSGSNILVFQKRAEL